MRTLRGLDGIVTIHLDALKSAIKWTMEYDPKVVYIVFPATPSSTGVPPTYDPTGIPIRAYGLTEIFEPKPIEPTGQIVAMTYDASGLPILPWSHAMVEGPLL